MDDSSSRHSTRANETESQLFFAVWRMNGAARSPVSEKIITLTYLPVERCTLESAN